MYMDEMGTRQAAGERYYSGGKVSVSGTCYLDQGLHIAEPRIASLTGSLECGLIDEAVYNRVSRAWPTCVHPASFQLP